MDERRCGGSKMVTEEVGVLRQRRFECGGDCTGLTDSVWDRVYRKTRSLFGICRKSPPEKFSGGGGVVVAGMLAGEDGGWPAVRPSMYNSYIYEPSTVMLDVINFLDDQRRSFLQLQEKHNVEIPCYLDSQYSGMVEASA
ncbi:hypothetical protein Tco_0590767 [Tanacetum coccineum]